MIDRHHLVIHLLNQRKKKRTMRRIRLWYTLVFWEILPSHETQTADWKQKFVSVVKKEKRRLTKKEKKVTWRSNIAGSLTTRLLLSRLVFLKKLNSSVNQRSFNFKTKGFIVSASSPFLVRRRDLCHIFQGSFQTNRRSHFWKRCDKGCFRFSFFVHRRDHFPNNGGHHVRHSFNIQC